MEWTESVRLQLLSSMLLFHLELDISIRKIKHYNAKPHNM